MNDNGKEIQISLRLSTDDNQLLENYMADHGIENRSVFIRDLIRDTVTGAKTKVEEGEDGIYVRLNQVQLQTLENMKEDGTIFDAESYIRQLIMSDIVPKDSLEDSKSRAFKAAQQASRMM